MSGFLEPGVQVVHNTPLARMSELSTAVPLFIGYTEKGGAGKVYELSNFDSYLSTCGGPAITGGDKGFVLYNVLEHYFQAGGSGCYVLSLGHYDDFSGAGQELLECLETMPWSQVWAEAKYCTLMALPDLSLLDNADDSIWVNVWRLLLSQQVRDNKVFIVLDGPDDPVRVGNCLKELAKSDSQETLAYGALYWPRLIPLGRYSIERVPLPCSAAVIVVMQQTDQERGIWKAPANEEVLGILRPTYDCLPHLQAGSAQLNIIRAQLRRGIRVWGDRTLLPDDIPLTLPWRYVQVRRTASYLQNALRELTRFAVFEPNNALTWVKLEGVIRVWLRALWMAGGLAGRLENEAFQIRIGLDKSMTKEDLDNGLLIVEIDLAFYAPAEFIELRLQIVGAEAQVELWTTASNQSEVGSWV